MAEILKDYPITDTIFRALIIDGDFCKCAYIGVPLDSCLANQQTLEFDCHYGITFRGEGGDGIRPEGYYWYGWDYGHCGDKLKLPDGLPDEIRSQFEAVFGKNRKEWTLAEVEEDVWDVAMALKEQMELAEQMLKD